MKANASPLGSVAACAVVPAAASASLTDWDALRFQTHTRLLRRMVMSRPSKLMSPADTLRKPLNAMDLSRLSITGAPLSS